MLVSEIYYEVCSDLMERGGLQLGLVTNAQFLEYFVDTLGDFVQKTGMAKTIAVLTQQFGISEYEKPDWFGDIQTLLVNESMVFESTEFDVAGMNQDWRNKVAAIRAWFEDKTAMKNFDVFPAAPQDGGQVTVAGGGGFYGTIRNWTAGDIDVQATEPFYGTIRDESGGVALLPSGPFLGTIRGMAFSKGNLSLIGTAAVFDQNPTLTSIVELIPDSFSAFISYGVLARIFGNDGETKDEIRRRYCAARYDEGVMLGKLIMAEELMDEEAA